MNAPETIETARLYLRAPRLEDAEAIFEQYAQDVDVTRYLTWRPHETIETTRTFLRRCLAVWQEGSSFPLSIIRKEDDQLIGMIEIRVDRHKAEAGYGLARRYWGNNYMTEALAACAAWALQQPAIFRFGAVCDIENLASARVMEKAGLQREGILRRWIIHPNQGDEPRDCYSYSLTR